MISKFANYKEEEGRNLLQASPLFAVMNYLSYHYSVSSAGSTGIAPC